MKELSMKEVKVVSGGVSGDSSNSWWVPQKVYDPWDTYPLIWDVSRPTWDFSPPMPAIPPLIQREFL